MEKGVPGVYHVKESGYGSAKRECYIYCRSLDEAQQMSKMFLEPHLDGRTPYISILQPADPDVCMEWSQVAMSDAQLKIAELRGRIKDIEELIEKQLAFQEVASMVTNSISVNLAEESLKNLGDE